MPPLGKRGYIPPQPDEDTFETQQLFLDSLFPVPVDSIAEDNRKCCHCWKQYGESDPNLDNAENPVKFRCGHVFGERCMKEQLFCLPELVKTELLPLSFEADSRGRRLGISLKKCVQSLGDDAAVPAARRVPKACSRLMRHFWKNRGYKDMDFEWSTHIKNILSFRHRILKVHFMENAIINDRDEVPAKYQGPPPFHVWLSAEQKLNGSEPKETTYNEELVQIINSAWAEVSDSVPPPASPGSMSHDTAAAGIQTEDLITSPIEEMSDPIKPTLTTPSDGEVLTEGDKCCDSGQEKNEDDETKLSEDCTSAEKARAASKKQFYIEKIKKWNKDRAEEEVKRKTDTHHAFVRALVEVYEAFEKFEQENPGIGTSESSVTPSPMPLGSSLHPSFLASSDFHPKTLAETHLHTKLAYAAIYDDPPSDIEPDDDEEETKEPPKFVILGRQLCSCKSGCFSNERDRKIAREELQSVQTKSVDWKKDRKVINACPLCSKVLFKIGNFPSRISDFLYTWHNYRCNGRDGRVVSCSAHRSG